MCQNVRKDGRSKPGEWIEDLYTFVRNRRGGLNLIYNGFLYTAERSSSSSCPIYFIQTRYTIGTV
ncbi:uncharacterized protein LOC142226877 isoform X3 [Haematobia irritans]|uniref:uncharacterized protein LOC142226877 isoform X3 n=1 Tax=Haematobia irritans TaxID=7368 RepID=UPI003F5000D9